MTRLAILVSVCACLLAGGMLAWAYFSATTSAESNTFTAAAVDHITVSPSTASITSGGSQPFTDTALDSSNNSFGDVTSKSTFTITPDGSCTGNSCTATVSGDHTVTAHFWGLTATATLTVLSGDGSGALTTTTTNVANGSTGNTIALTYTAATGGLSNGEVDVAVPTGWTAPSAGNAAGCTTTSSGTLGFSGQTIKVSALTLPASGTLTITYGATTGGACTSGDGAKATTTAGAATWQGQEKSTAGGTLTNISSPSINVYAADGTGALSTTTTSVSASSTGNTVAFTYTAANAGGMSNGEVDIAVPSGWTAPTAGNAVGCTTTSTGSLAFSGQTIKVSSVTLAPSGTLNVTYGATSGGACSAGDGATATSTTGAQIWQGSQKSTSGGALASITSPSITVFAADGSGTLTTTTTTVVNGSTGNTIAFTYTAATGGISNGEVDIAVPTGWTAPTSSNAVGCTTASTGTLSFSGQTIQVSALTLGSAGVLTVTYGATSGASCAASDGAKAPTTAGAATWQGQERSTGGGTLANVSPSPSITVLSADGSGTLTTTTTGVPASSTQNSIAFTYTAGVGCTSATAGTVSTSSQTITVGNLTLAASGTTVVTYGATSGGACVSGDGATAPATTGAQVWQGKETSSSGGTLTNLASSPSITVFAANGSGTLTTTTTNVTNGSSGNTIAFTYTAATGGISNGTVTIAVPSGWTAPVTTAAAGCTSATVGTVSASGQLITVSALSLTGGSSTVITYGATSGGLCTTGDGATATTTGGSATWQAQEASTSGATLTNLAASPSINVYAADGSGTLGTTTTNVSSGSTNTIAFTYTAAAGGMSNGEVDIAVPSGWSAPTASLTNGCTTTSAGSLAFSGQSIKVSSLTLGSGATLTVTYGATSAPCSTGDGGKAPTTGGAATWQGSEKSTSGGGLTNLTASPSINVYAADGSGTLGTTTTTVNASSTGNTIVFTYTAAAGGFPSGEVDIAVPTGWTAPSASNAIGCTTVSTGTLGFSSQTIKVSGLSLAGGATLTVTYGATSGASCTTNDGATATSTSGAQTWQGSQKSLATDALVNLAASPSITVNAATPPTPTSITVANGTGTQGQPDAGDVITITWPRAMAVSTFCATWSNNGANQTLTTEVDLNRNGNGNTTLAVPGTPCAGSTAFNLGAFNFGADYISGTGTKTSKFTSSTIAYNATTFKLTITLGTASGQATQQVTATAQTTYTPSTTITDTNGVATSGSVTSTAAEQF